MCHTRALHAHAHFSMQTYTKKQIQQYLFTINCVFLTQKRNLSEMIKNAKTGKDLTLEMRNGSDTSLFRANFASGKNKEEQQKKTGEATDLQKLRFMTLKT